MNIKQDIEAIRKAAFAEVRHLCDSAGYNYDASGHFIERFNLRCSNQVEGMKALVVAVRTLIGRGTPNKYSVNVGGHIFLLLLTPAMSLRVLTYSLAMKQGQHFDNATKITLVKKK